MKIKYILTSLLLGASLSLSAAAPKYIFYFIGDGMGIGAVSATQTYNRTVLGNTEPLLMLQFPVGSTAFTFSASSPVTDSAAAGTALASGHKTNNSMLGVTPDTTAVTSIARVLKDNGYGIGLVTSVCPDDATPGAFYAHQPRRSMYYEIGKEAATSGYEFIGGSNLRGTKDSNGNPNDLMKIFAENGVSVVRGLDALKTVNTRRVFLLNTDSVRVGEIGYTIDSLDNVLTLPAMTEACLDHLMKNSPDKFFMMVEGGAIDHAAHSNDAGTVVMETLNFDQALKVAYDFYLQHPTETLIVVTADHDTGGMALANSHLHYYADLSYLAHQKVSKDMFSEWCRSILKSGKPYSWPEMKQYLTDKLGFFTYIPVNEKQEAALKAKFDKTITQRKGKDQKSLYNSFNEFAVEVFDIISRVSGIGWTTGDHSGAVVPVYAIGQGAAMFSNWQDNTDIPRKIISLAGYSLK